LLHGNPDTHDVWSEVARRLAPNRRCIAPDLPGFGGSKAPDDFDCSLDNQGAFVAEVVDAIGVSKVHLVVHDLGGIYGLAFATKYPERLRSLTIMNTAFFPDTPWHFWARVWRTPVLGELTMAVANRPLFVNQMMRGAPGMSRDYAHHAYDGFGRDAKRMVLRWYRAIDFPVVVRGWDERLLAATKATKKQVVWGDRDPYISPPTADRFGATVHRFAESGHWVMVEKPEETAQLVASLADAADAEEG
jgi:pimeloyl-ACP methyl ester carboxylesterase